MKKIIDSPFGDQVEISLKMFEEFNSRIIKVYMDFPYNKVFKYNNTFRFVAYITGIFKKNAQDIYEYNYTDFAYLKKINNENKETKIIGQTLDNIKNDLRNFFKSIDVNPYVKELTKEYLDYEIQRTNEEIEKLITQKFKLLQEKHDNKYGE